MSIGILEDMTSLDFKSPFDELAELRDLLTTQEIADFTGLRRETISRARPDSRFQRRTEQALADLYIVVTKVRSTVGEDLGQLAAVLRRPQAEFAGRSIADLLREGQAEVVLDSLRSGAPEEAQGPVKPRVDPAIGARVAAVLEADPELRARLSEIEAALVRHFGPGSEVERRIVSEFCDDPEGSDELYLHVSADLPLDESIGRLASFLEQEEDLLAPVRAQLTIGFL